MKRIRSAGDGEPALPDADDGDMVADHEEEDTGRAGPKRLRADRDVHGRDGGAYGGGIDDASDAYARDIRVLNEQTQRLHAGTADAGDMREIMRLVAGHIESGTQAARWGGGFYQRLLNAYDGLWEALSWGDGIAAAAVAEAARAGRISGWPPTFADVQSVYAELEPATAGLHVARIEQQNAANLRHAGQALGSALAQAVRRRAAIASLDPSAFSLVADAHALAPSLACAPASPYYLLRFYVNTEAWVMLVNLAPRPGQGPLVLAISIPDDARRIRYRARVAAPAHSLTAALQPLMGQMGLFLAALARSAPWEDPVPLDAPSSSILEPLPAGAAQIDALMVPVPSSLALPSAVQYALTLIGPENVSDIDDGALYGTEVDECHLALAIRLFVGQIDARAMAAVARRQARTSLTERAAAVYTGPLDPLMAPHQVLDRAAAYAWRRTCAAPALPDGHLADSERLVEAAALWGIDVDPSVAARRPELLCSQLASEGAARLRAPLA
ncbi:hypothetical protein pdul_cds_1056 [Pandoravirus dulcis]|uniref:DUF5848 domain-containing protein n=1 Tax=Pandoravirus dulcis TaxID=1349409 RepID=S4VV78_9VIRU|nr:hypothetical protein pdul_cds_1056 [Pandoravirus dulcis]AGO83335.1 hypothetical protein pdul_cds_1056 [Pandoravirus dulcis]